MAAALIAACNGSDEGSSQADPAAASSAAEEREAGIDPRDQYALAHAIAQARASREHLDSALARTRSEWIGRRYRWEMAFMPPLCGPTGPCVLLPFDHHRDPEHPIRQGWLPRVELSEQGRQALAEACQGRTRCVVEVSGRLGQLELSVDLPTSMTLSEVEIHGTREAAPGESWVLAPRRPVMPRRTAATKAAEAAGVG